MQKKNILDAFYAVWAVGRFLASFLVGLRRYDSHRFCRMVDSLPQRLALSGERVHHATNQTNKEPYTRLHIRPDPHRAQPCCPSR